MGFHKIESFPQSTLALITRLNCHWRDISTVNIVSLRQLMLVCEFPRDLALSSIALPCLTRFSKLQSLDLLQFTSDGGSYYPYIPIPIEALPRSLTYLNLGCRAHIFTHNFTSITDLTHLNSLHIWHLPSIATTGISYPTSLTSLLVLNVSKPFNLGNLPSSLKHLRIQTCSVMDLSTLVSLPCSVEDLEVTHLTDEFVLPTHLSHLNSLRIGGKEMILNKNKTR